MADIFLELPEKKVYPDYYETIKRPIAIAQIERVSFTLLLLVRMGCVDLGRSGEEVFGSSTLLV